MFDAEPRGDVPYLAQANSTVANIRLGLAKSTNHLSRPSTSCWLQKIQIPSQKEWREWLSKNHDKERQGIWLMFYKKNAGRPTMEYDESVEEALCFGWIDSIIKKIDEKKYCRKFTPRKSNSKWSSLNKRRVTKLIEEDRMTEYGLAKIEEAKRSGRWDTDPRPDIRFDMPGEFSRALTRSIKATDYFENLSPTNQKQYIGWVVTAKHAETKEKRIIESIRLLEQGKKLGLK